MPNRRAFLKFAAALLCCSAFAQAHPQAQPLGIQWTAAASRVDAEAPDALYAEMEADPHHDLKGIVILRDGRLVSEHYFNGDDAGTLHDIRSATKSITSLLMGIAIAQGKVSGSQASIARYLPGLPHDGKEKIRIVDLLNMRSGLDADDEDPKSPGNEDRLDESADWMRALYALPMKRQPGTQYLYCSANAFLAGAIVENATHMPLVDFARRNLFSPLGIRDFRWRHVPVNRTTGQGNLEITARDMAAIGEMVRNGGTIAGHRVVPQAWIDSSLASQVPISAVDPFADGYGYMWYTRAEPVNGAPSPCTSHPATAATRSTLCPRCTRWSPSLPARTERDGASAAHRTFC